MGIPFFPHPMTTLAVVINDLANSWAYHQCNYFWGCRQFRRRLKKNPINDFLKWCWWHPGWQHRMATGCVNQNRTTGIDFSLSLSPPCRTVSPELKSYALGVLFLLLRLLGRYKSCMSFPPNLWRNTPFLTCRSWFLLPVVLLVSWVGSDTLGSKPSPRGMSHQGSWRHFSCYLCGANGRKCSVAWEMTVSPMVPHNQFLFCSCY